MNATHDEARRLLWQMLRIRRFEEAAMDAVRKGLGIPGAVHICIGQEAAIVGSCLAVRDDDFM
ncbi:MAG: pyruvate dehydrogenase (acetyl-transferring) E1 component subunit alpha, partial [Actinomycetes bacterium]